MLITTMAWGVVRALSPWRDFEKTSVRRKRAHALCSPREGHLLKQEESKQKGLALQTEPEPLGEVATAGITVVKGTLVCITRIKAVLLSWAAWSDLQDGEGHAL